MYLTISKEDNSKVLNELSKFENITRRMDSRFAVGIYTRFIESQVIKLVRAVDRNKLSFVDLENLYNHINWLSRSELNDNSITADFKLLDSTMLGVIKIINKDYKPGEGAIPKLQKKEAMFIAPFPRKSTNPLRAGSFIYLGRWYFVIDDNPNGLMMNLAPCNDRGDLEGHTTQVSGNTRNHVRKDCRVQISREGVDMHGYWANSVLGVHLRAEITIVKEGVEYVVLPTTENADISPDGTVLYGNTEYKIVGGQQYSRMFFFVCKTNANDRLALISPKTFRYNAELGEISQSLFSELYEVI